MSKDMFKLYSENRRTNLRVWLKMRWSIGDRMVNVRYMGEGKNVENTLEGVTSHKKSITNVLI